MQVLRRGARHGVCGSGHVPALQRISKRRTIAGIGAVLPTTRVRVRLPAFSCSWEKMKSPEEIFSDYIYFSSYSTSWLAHCSAFADRAVEEDAALISGGLSSNSQATTAICFNISSDMACGYLGSNRPLTLRKLRSNEGFRPRSRLLRRTDGTGAARTGRYSRHDGCEQRLGARAGHQRFRGRSSACC